MNGVEIELMEMGFTLKDVKRVMSIVDSKEKAVEILLGEKELNSVQGEVMELSEKKKDDENEIKDDENEMKDEN